MMPTPYPLLLAAMREATRVFLPRPVKPGDSILSLSVVRGTSLAEGTGPLYSIDRHVFDDEGALQPAETKYRLSKYPPADEATQLANFAELSVFVAFSPGPGEPWCVTMALAPYDNGSMLAVDPASPKHRVLLAPGSWQLCIPAGLGTLEQLGIGDVRKREKRGRDDG